MSIYLNFGPTRSSGKTLDCWYKLAAGMSQEVSSNDCHNCRWRRMTFNVTCEGSI